MVATLLTLDYLAERAKAADLRAFDRVRAQPPLPGGELKASPASAGSGRSVADEVRQPARRYRATKTRQRSRKK